MENINLQLFSRMDILITRTTVHLTELAINHRVALAKISEMFKWSPLVFLAFAFGRVVGVFLIARPF